MGSWFTKLSNYMGGWCSRKLNSMGGWVKKRCHLPSQVFFSRIALTCVVGKSTCAVLSTPKVIL